MLTSTCCRTGFSLRYKPVANAGITTKIDKLPDCTYNVFMIDFEWNKSKATSNLKKHGISFEEAKTTFFDEYAIQFFDDSNSSEEDRFILLGMSSETRILIVSHCERNDGKLIRIISARKATAKERKFYKR